MNDLIRDITQFGKKRANPDAGENALKLEACASAAGCEDTVTHTLTSPQQSSTVDSAILGGTSYPFTTPVSVVGADAVVAANIQAALLADVVEKLEFDNYLKVSKDGNDLTITHRGQYTLESFTLGTGDVITLTRCCTVVQLNKFQAGLEGEFPDFSYNGSSETLATGTYAWTGTEATDNATAATLKGDIETALGNLSYDYNEVIVEVDNVNEQFLITIWTELYVPIQIGSAYFTFCAYKQAFDCA